MPRLLFEKTGRAVWISHLDLMRLFQRAFKRSGLTLKHTQGFHPRPSVSIALPLPVGTESLCELLDFDLEHEFCDWGDLSDRLNASLTEGVKVLQAYSDGKKIKDLSLMTSEITLAYDSGIPDGALTAITALLNQPHLTVTKKTKNGLQEQDIIPMIKRFTVNSAGERELVIRVLHHCQNPSLNPMQISAAITKYLPEYTPDFSKSSRIEIYDSNEFVFR